VLEEAEKIKDIARLGASPLIGAIRIGLIYTVGPYLLPELIPVLIQNAPDMPLDVEENTTANLESQLRQGLIDVAVIALPFALAGIETTALYDEDFVVVVPIHHPWAGRKSIAATDFSEEKVLLLNSGHCFSNQVNQACPELSKSGEVLQGNSLETIRNMVASGLGITVLPRSAASERYANPLLKVIPFSAPIPTRRIALAWRKSFGRVDAVKMLASSVRAIKSECFEVVTG
jgi:LysR family hydrogen peroxide-inducible transcriptional activator